MKHWFAKRHHAGSYMSMDTLEASERRPEEPSALSLFDDPLWGGESSSSESEGIASGPDKTNKKSWSSTSANKPHGIAPSKPLLLGFLDLASRLRRSWVIASDLVRWCSDGILPFSDLWNSDCIPARYKQRFWKIPKSFERR